MPSFKRAAATASCRSGRGVLHVAAPPAAVACLILLYRFGKWHNPCFYQPELLAFTLSPWQSGPAERRGPGLPAARVGQGEVMSNKLVVILVGLLFILVLGLGGGMIMIWTKLSAVGAVVAPPVDEKNAEKPKAEEIGKIVSMDTFIVNLADPGGNRYLRLTMDLEVVGGKPAEEEMAKRVPQLRDAILMILPTKRYADICTTEGKTAIREELTSAVNGLLASAKVARIYFKEFVIQ
jgi:flagellar FliL protein